MSKVLSLGALLACALTAISPLGSAAQAALLAGLAAVWFVSRPSRRQLVISGAGLGLTIGFLMTAWVLEKRSGSVDSKVWIGDVEQAYVRLGSKLEEAAENAALALHGLDLYLEERLELFQLLQGLSQTDEFHGLTLIFFDADGEAIAWAGEGLLHEPDAFDLPASGLAFLRGYSSLTLYATAPVTEQKRPQQVVVGQSLATDRLSFVPEADPGHQWAWSLSKEENPPDEENQGHTVSGTDPAWQLQVGGLVRLAPTNMPILHLVKRQAVLRDAQGAAATSPIALPVAVNQARWAAGLALSLTLLALAFPGGTAETTALLSMAAMAVASGLFDLEPQLRVALVIGLGLSLWGLLRPRRDNHSPWGGEILGALVVVVVTALAWGFQNIFGTPDLAIDLGGEPRRWALRLASALLTLGLLTCLTRTRGPARGDRVGWIAILLFIAAAAFHDHPLFALPALACGGAAAGRWLRSLDFQTRPMALGGLLLLASAAGAVAWELAHREVLRRHLPEQILPLVAPPSQDEVYDFHLEIQEYFDDFDLSLVSPPGSGLVDPRNLAFVLWHDSPLPQRDGASALIVRGSDVNSSFSFGLPMIGDLEVDLQSDSLPIPRAATAWHEADTLGDARLLLDGKPWGVVEYTFLPRPGFRLAVDEITELDEALLRTEAHRDSIDGLPRPALFGMYLAEGPAILSPWQEAPPLDEQIATQRRGSVDTLSGRSWYWASEHDGVVTVLYLPWLSPIEGLERVGNHMLTSVMAMAILIFGVLGILLPIGDLRGVIGNVVHSYSKRLLLVYVSLLLVPLVALNLVLLRSFEDRLHREQIAAGQASLSSARLILSNFIKGLTKMPGVLIDTEIDRGLLDWISKTVRHQVNFYWRGQLYASSHLELFTAGLLPRRIPGDVYADLALLGQEVGRRTQRQRLGDQAPGDLAYVELYTLLEDIGGSEPYFLSVPLLQQKEEVARELAGLRRRAILVTTALVLLLLAVGSRLAASFTKPIMELIEGTRKIAAGAPFLGVTPRERELSALADAIDEMAQTVAEGRKKLMLEKRVVERMVENITSGVVSLDHGRRVLLHNRVAEGLLGTKVGIRIDDKLAAQERLRPMAEFLKQLDGEEVSEIHSKTLQLSDDGEMREWTLTWVPVPGPEDPAALLVVDDDTEVLRGERLEAWAEMARIIAHEIKNPLTPIRLSAEHLRMVYQTSPERLGEVFDRCTTNILTQVEELRDIASDFSTYSRIPRAELVEGDLVASMRALIAAYHDSPRGGVGLGFECEIDELQVAFDEKLLGRAVRNLVENALRASAGTIERALESGEDIHRPYVVLSLERRDTKALIAVEDSGPGVDPDNLTRIFEPYFSTHETGTGLGLAIAQRIVKEHGGRMEARNRPGGGLAVMITIPLGG